MEEAGPIIKHRRPTAGSGATACSALIIAVTVVAAAPITVAVLSLLGSTGDVWSHLLEYVLPVALVNTLWLVIGVATIAGVLGVSLAWIVAILCIAVLALLMRSIY